LPAPAHPVLAFTGERFAPEVKGAIWHEHWHRYCAVRPLAAGKRVLDAACGEGYGSFLLAGVARDVIGVDIASEAIAHAHSRYEAPNLRYVRASCSALPLPQSGVDLVVSFETIEHLAAQREMLAEFRRVLAPGGVLVLSSPNQPVYSAVEQGHNEFHVRELTREELAALLDPFFPAQRWYGQRVVAHSALWAEAAGATPRAATAMALAGDDIRTPAEPAPPMYFVVVCADAGVALPELPALSLFDDGAQSLYRDYTRALRREKELAWEELDARKIGEDRLAELITAVNELGSERERTGAQAARIASLEAAGERAAGELTEARARLDVANAELATARAEVVAAADELVRAANELAAMRAECEEARGAVAGARAELATARTDLDHARRRLAAIEAELAAARADHVRALDEVSARLAYRETFTGWLRWPLARLRLRLQAAG
jgi:SAM-dependent methyltransferase